jgi:DNA-binding NarL/FixJ family response regulator
MTRVYIANDKLEERNALRLLLIDLNMEVVGESADWSSTLAHAPASRADMLLIDWDLIPNHSDIALKELRKACLAAIVIVILSYLDARHQAAISSGANVFISKTEAPERIADRLRLAAASANTITHPVE